MNRFFIEIEQLQLEENVINIEGEDVKHIKDVLRLKVGDTIEALCEKVVYVCKIKSIEKTRILLDIIDSYEGKNEAPIRLCLYQGLAKGQKMDFIIQKATEIGVSAIYPILTNRTVVKINDMKKENKKVERWNKIALEAAKQCKRDVVPIVHNIISFEEVLHLLKNEENILVPYEEEESIRIKDIINKFSDEKIHIIIGPEGGFESEEIDKLKEMQSQIVSLGPRILRTETAGLVAMSVLLYELGDL